MGRIFTIAIFLLASSAISAQDVKVTAAFDSSRIFIGDQTHFTVTVERPAGLLLTLPVQKDTLLRHIEILKGPVTDTAMMKDGRIRIHQKYLVTSFDSGFYQVPPVYAEMQTANGIKRFYSDYSPLTVMRVRIALPDTAQKIFDIIKPYRAPVTAGEILPWLLFSLVLATVAWYSVRLIRRLRMKRGAEEPPVPNPDPAHVIALRDLEKLKEEKLWQNGKTKSYYTRLTEIVRQYLENRFGIQSLELTTAETLSLLKKTGFREDELFLKLRTLLTGADLVKFAKYKPDASENELNYDHAWDFVSLTRLVEEPLQSNDVKSDNREGA
ncbi:MAG: hypothetical protein ABR974_01655 [Bacteroidales bacterium]|jgi:hypothetical protein